MRDLLTTYASVLEEQGARNTFEREGAISDDLKADSGACGRAPPVRACR